MAEERQATRREFLQTGAKGVAAAAFLSSCSTPPEPAASPPAHPPTNVRTLGRTGLEVPIVGMGTAYAMELVSAALDSGIRYLHTSSSYSERNHERLLGSALRSRRRDSFVLGTSPDLPARFPADGSPSMDVGVDFDPGVIATSMHASLRLLGLDHVDVYYLASVGTRRTALHEPYIRAYQQLKREGLTRFIGIITHSHEPEVITAATESGAWDVVVTAYNFRQSHRAAVADAIAAAARAGLGVIAMKTQAGVYWDRFHLRKINMRAALKWVLQNEHVHTVIPAFSNFDELREDLEVMANPALTPGERSDLKLGERAGLTGVFCQQCGGCLPQCPLRVNVPALMRASMYQAGHGRPDKGRRLLAGWAPADIPCAGCSRCHVKCALGLDVRAAALDVVPLLAQG
ncbi:MAG: aldo/keto reductase [Bacteroidales bacterium]